MASNNNTFTALTTGTRDLTDDPGAVYYLDGNATNGRLNISDGAVLSLGESTTIVTDGNAGHSYMNGLIRGKDIKIISEPGSGQRVDPVNQFGGFDADGLHLLSLGAGAVFNLLEDRNDKSNFRRYLILEMKMTGGGSYYQFNSREYPNVTISLLPGNAGIMYFYPARSFEGFSSFPGLKINGITDTQTTDILKGTKNDSHGRIYDPEYRTATGELLTNNAARFRRSGGSSTNDSFEFFTINVTSIRHDAARIRVSDSTGAVLHNDVALTADNTQILDNEGDPLGYYRGQNVIACQVRRINSTASSSRNTISYTIRRAGFNQIKVDDFSMNAPVVIQELLADERYDSSITDANITGISITNETITVTNNTTLQELYNYIRHWEAQAGNLATDVFMTFNGAQVHLGNYSLVVDGATLSTGTNLTRIGSAGTVTTINNGEVTVTISDANGDSNGTLVLPEGFTEASIHTTQANADNNMNAIATGTQFRYDSSTIGGQTVWVRATGGLGEIVTSLTVPTEAGENTFEILITPIDTALARIENRQTAILQAIENQRQPTVE